VVVVVLAVVVVVAVLLLLPPLLLLTLLVVILPLRLWRTGQCCLSLRNSGRTGARHRRVYGHCCKSTACTG
jgi:hypothetical protein